MFSKKKIHVDKKLKPKKSLIEIKEYIDQHYNEPLSNTQLAQMADITPKYFGELFKKTFGQSVMNYLTNRRIQQAKRYLTQSTSLIREIAVEVGYSDEFYFSRKFKKEVGMSPSEFVKNSKTRIAACSPIVIGQLLALNIIPMAAPLDPKWTAYYYNTYHSQIQSHLKLCNPYTSSDFEDNMRKLCQNRPDVIIGTNHHCPLEKKKLLAIAPTYFVPTDQLGWQDQLNMIAQFLEREESADLWINQYRYRVQSAREQIKKAIGGDKIVVLRIYERSIHLYWNRGLEDVLYQDLKLDIIFRENKPLSMKQLIALNPDWILLVVCQETTSRSYWLALQHSIEWRQLNAVRNGHLYQILSDPWFEYSPFSIMRILNDAVLLFTGNCPNDFQDSVHGNPLLYDI